MSYFDVDFKWSTLEHHVLDMMSVCQIVDVDINMNSSPVSFQDFGELSGLIHGEGNVENLAARSR